MKCLAVFGGLFVLMAGQAHAATELIIQAPAATPDLGNVLRGSGATTFRIDAASGAVTRTAGNAVRLSATAVSPPTIRLTCVVISLPNLCIARAIRVTIQPLASSGPASITMLQPGALSGATFQDGLPAPAPTLVFDLNPMGLGTTTMKLGLDVLLGAGAASGPATFDYSVTARFL